MTVQIKDLNLTVNQVKEIDMSILKLTPAAETQIDTICNENNVIGVTLNLKGGGCAGFEYDWGTISDAREIGDGDEILATAKGHNFVVGSHSLMFLIGTEVDYVKSLVGSNFEIRNPNAQSSCGCGVSVNFNI
jgi:iron-sulfur cluster assembly accessory protein